MVHVMAVLERPQKNPGVERVHEVDIIGCKGEPVGTIPELAYKDEFFENENISTEEQVADAIKDFLNCDDVIVDVVEGW